MRGWTDRSNPAVPAEGPPLTQPAGAPARAADRDRQHQDDLQRLAQCGWVVEAMSEQPEPKRALCRRLEEVLPGHAIVTTNTSGIPMRVLAEGRGESFRRRFLGTHFFNPVCYMHLLEVIPAPETDPGVLSLQPLRAAGAVLEENPEAALLDLGGDVLLLEFRARWAPWVPAWSRWCGARWSGS